MLEQCNVGFSNDDLSSLVSKIYHASDETHAGCCLILYPYVVSTHPGYCSVSVQVSSRRTCKTVEVNEASAQCADKSSCASQDQLDGEDGPATLNEHET